MGVLDPLLLRAAGSQVSSAVPHLAKMQFGMSVGKAALLGAGIGGVAGLARGDNYSSTAALRNFTAGAAGGMAVGLGSKALLSKRGLRGIGNMMMGPVPKLAGTGVKLAGNGLNAGMKTAGYLAARPHLAFAGAAVVGGAMYMGGAFSGGRFDNAEAGEEAENMSVTSRSFQNSASGLVQGLHRSRHRGG